VAEKSPAELQQEQLDEQRKLEEQQTKEREELRRKNETPEQRQAREAQEKSEREQTEQMQLLLKQDDDRSGYVTYGSIGPLPPGEPVEVGTFLGKNENGDELKVSEADFDRWRENGTVVKKDEHPYYIDYSDRPEGLVANVGFGVGPAVEDPTPPRPVSETPPGHQVVTSKSTSNPNAPVPGGVPERVSEERAEARKTEAQRLDPPNQKSSVKPANVNTGTSANKTSDGKGTQKS
jgi:hypothetical protein